MAKVRGRGATPHLWLLPLLLLATHCGEPPGPPNVLLYVIDTLRADSLAPYGNTIVDTPTVTRLADEGVLYRNAYAHSSWTRPSIASILTGQPPDLHGVLTREDHLGPSIHLLAESFQRAGYATGAIITNPNVGSHFGFDRGYDTFLELYDQKDGGVVDDTRDRASSDVVTARAIEWIESLDRPFFLFVLTTDPHWPYKPPETFDRYRPGAILRGPTEARWRVQWARARYDMARYYGEIAFNDHSLGELLDRLEDTGSYDETLVVFTADHGEEFAEHGGSGHGHTLYEEQVRVPLIVRDPRASTAGESVQWPAQLIDVAPTLLSLAGLPVPDTLPGRSLQSVDAATPRSVFATLDLDGRRGHMLIEPPWKLIEPLPSESETRPLVGGLFNLAEDPAELEDASASAPERAREMRARLAARAEMAAERVAERGGQAEELAVPPLPDDVREALEVLGYLNADDAPGGVAPSDKRVDDAPQ